MVYRREGREASTGFDKTPEFWTANGGPQGERSESSPLSPPNSKRKPGFASRLFFCMMHRREGREASTGFDKTPAFWTANGGPQGERSESTPLSPPNSKRKPGFASRLFFCMVYRREGCASLPLRSRLPFPPVIREPYP
jgi:hypothetical protein